MSDGVNSPRAHPHFFYVGLLVFANLLRCEKRGCRETRLITVLRNAGAIRTPFVSFNRRRKSARLVFFRKDFGFSRFGGFFRLGGFGPIYRARLLGPATYLGGSPFP